MRFHYFFTFVFLFFLSFSAYSTHIQGAQISYQKLNFPSRTYKFVLQVFRDTGLGSVDQPEATLNFGDGTSCGTKPVLRRSRVSGDAELLTFEFEHVFARDGEYKVSFNEENRNANINNINDGNAIPVSFNVSCLVYIHPDTPNDSFVYTGSPILKAVSGSAFSSTVQGYDPEGDSLAFQFAYPKAFNEGERGCGFGLPFVVPKYKLPNDATFYQNQPSSSRLISINPFSGNILWESPGKPGIYSIAVRILEFRNKNLVGFTIIDFQLTVLESETEVGLVRKDNTPVKDLQVIDVLVDVPIELEIEIQDTSPDNDSLNLEAYSELLTNKNATFTLTETKISKSGKFSFVLTPELVRESPYIITFRGTKSPLGFRKDLTFVLNPKKDKAFNFTQDPSRLVTDDPTVSDPLGFGTDKKSKLMVAFPNPSRASFYVNTFNFSKPSIILYNNAGTKVRTQNLIVSEQAEVRRESLKPGLYFYEIYSRSEKAGIGKVILE